MSRRYHRTRLLLWVAPSLAAALLCVAPALARTITGICPDGSIFIVQRAEAIPCRNAKEVEPSEVPPLNPEFLPRPYGWERFNQETDPNNPYNLVDSVRPGTAPSGALPPTPESALQNLVNQVPPTPGGAATPAPPPVLPPAPIAPPPAQALDFGLSPTDVRDLAAIVALMQERAPAAVVRRDAAGNPLLVVRVARSAAFDARLRDALARRDTPASGPVVLFDAVAAAPETFYGNFTFVQGHAAFHSDTSNPAQFGLLVGALGDVAPSQSLLGYAVLPAHIDLARPIDIYWNDLQISATLRP